MSSRTTCICPRLASGLIAKARSTWRHPIRTRAPRPSSSWVNRPEKAAAADQRHQPAFQITHAAHEPSPVFSVPLALPLRRATAQTLPKRPVEK
jgi:hypothetical protein